MKKVVKQLKGKTPTLEVKKNGQHVGILNTETTIEDCVYHETETRPLIGDNLILPDYVREHLAYFIEGRKETYYGIIYPNENKFNKKIWNIDLIAQELANFTTVSKIIHWGNNVYIQLTRDKESEEIDLLFSTAFNWKD